MCTLRVLFLRSFVARAGPGLSTLNSQARGSKLPIAAICKTLNYLRAEVLLGRSGVTSERIFGYPPS